MPTPILYDSLLVHYLARELHARLRGRRLRRVRFDSDARRFTLELDDDRLVWELHATRGWIRHVPGAGAQLRGPGGEEGSEAIAAAEGWGGRRIRTQRRPRFRQVTAPPDERILEIEIDAGGSDRASRFVVELMTNQWNVLALDPERRIVSALWAREAGGRDLRSGVAYEPPGGFEPREGVEEPVTKSRFRAIVSDGDDPVRAIVRRLAWMSPMTARAVWGATGDDEGAEDNSIEQAYRRYEALARRPEAEPRVLELRGGQPYPLPLPGVLDEPMPGLLEGMEAVATREAPAGLAPEVRAALEERRERTARKAGALRRQLEEAPEKAAELRLRANVLMARLHTVPKGAEQVELEDFEGGTVRLSLDPTLSPAENAESLYDQAKRRERAAERLPSRVGEAEAEAKELEALLTGLDEGEADPVVLAAWLTELRPSGGGGGDEVRLPYRSFRSSGGLEIRVGRSGKANDELTFHHSAPDDIWLHARDVTGAHVILRWGRRDQNPPKRDLLEAAILAAVMSKARGSGTVPVDWTRRKHVRSPRNAPPGAVIPDRIQTLFVEPDPEVEERLSR